MAKRIKELQQAANEAAEAADEGGAWGKVAGMFGGDAALEAGESAELVDLGMPDLQVSPDANWLVL